MVQRALLVSILGGFFWRKMQIRGAKYTLGERNIQDYPASARTWKRALYLTNRSPLCCVEEEVDSNVVDAFAHITLLRVETLSAELLAQAAVLLSSEGYTRFLAFFMWKLSRRLWWIPAAWLFEHVFWIWFFIFWHFRFFLNSEMLLCGWHFSCIKGLKWSWAHVVETIKCSSAVQFLGL